jgi:hypothetical protein
VEKYGETFRNGQKGIIDSPACVGGWPELRQVIPPPDKDHDGMPDEWERLQKLDPANPGDSMDFTLSGSYTNLEVYLNSLTGEF